MAGVILQEARLVEASLREVQQRLSLSLPRWQPTDELQQVRKADLMPVIRGWKLNDQFYYELPNGCRLMPGHQIRLSTVQAFEITEEDIVDFNLSLVDEKASPYSEVVRWNLDLEVA